MTDAVRRQCWIITALALSLTALSAGAADPEASVPRSSEIDRSDLTASERRQAERWALTGTEWKRYRHLMEGIRGSVSPETISPIEVLGIHARNSSERRRYAEWWARLMREDAERILAFQRAYGEAMLRLFPNQLLIDPARLPKSSPEDEPVLRATDRVMFFTRPECGACDALLERLLARRDEVGGIDIFLSEIEIGDEAAVRAWAADQGIEPDWVRNSQVTLNFDDGVSAQLAPAGTEVPFLLRRRGESVEALSGAAW